MSKCPACGQEGPHFAPPAFGEEGFFMCQAKRTTFDSDALLANAHAHDVQQTESIRLRRIVEAVRNLREARRNLMQAMVAGDDSPHDHACVGKALEALFALVDDEP